jgi:hypothetical protein
MPNDTRIPLLDPILLMLRSRKVIIAITSIAVSLLVAYVPELRHIQDALIVLIGSLGLALIGGIAWEDAATAARTRAAQPVGVPLEEIRKAIIDALADGALLRRDPPSPY